MAAAIVFEDLGTQVRISWPGNNPSEWKFPKNSTVCTRHKTGAAAPTYYYRLTTHGQPVLDIYPPDMLTPATADIDALGDVLDAFFELANITTHSVLLADLQNGAAPIGWVFVSDLIIAGGTGLGGWLLVTQDGTRQSVARSGYGLLHECDWSSASNDYVSSYPNHTPGNPDYDCSKTNYGQWRPTSGNFLAPHGVVVGTFEPGEPVTQGVWTGVFCYDDGGVMTMYATDGKGYPVNGVVVTGTNSGATTQLTADPGVHQLTGGGIVCYMDESVPNPIYEHYLCVGWEGLFGDLNPAADPSYVKLPRGQANAGYIPRVVAIDYDMGVQDAQTIQGWLESIEYGGNKWVLSSRQATTRYLLDHSPLGLFPWGAPGMMGAQVNSGMFDVKNCGDLTLYGVEVGTGATFEPNLGRKSSVIGVVLETESTLGCTLPDQLDDTVSNNGVMLSAITLHAGKTLSGKTFTRSVGDMLVSADNTTTESLTYAPFTESGMRRFAKVFTVADLTTAGFDTTPGLLFFTTPSGTLPVGTVYLQYTYAGAAFALASDLVLRMDNGGSGNIAGRYSNGLLTAASDRQVSLPFPQLTSGASSKAMEAPWGANIYLSTFTGTALATGGGTSTLTVILEYKETTPLVV